jgi:hypothetical protein
VGRTILFEDGQAVSGSRGTNNFTSLERGRPAVGNCSGSALAPGDRCRLRDEAFAVRRGTETETAPLESLQWVTSGDQDRSEWNRVRAVSVALIPEAVVFADTTTWGDNARLAQIFEWRRDALRQHALILDALKAAAGDPADHRGWLGRASELLEMESADSGVHVRSALSQLRALMAFGEAGAADLAERCELFVTSRKRLYRLTAEHTPTADGAP